MGYQAKRGSDITVDGNGKVAFPLYGLLSYALLSYALCSTDAGYAASTRY